MRSYQRTRQKGLLYTVARIAMMASLTLLAGCYGKEFAKHETPLNSKLIHQMAEIGVDKRDAIFMRIFKREAELEVWKKLPSGKNALLKTYEICAWSGDLGPKFAEGDRQAPEGFYKVTPGLMNPNSSFHLAFNLGFPNAFDQSHERTGSFLMVHGACSSAGCYSMEDHQIEEIYGLAREAFLGGQEAFQVHAFPFRMTPANMALFTDDKNMPFWRTLKRGYEHFEVSGIVPKVDTCNKDYVFNATATDGGAFIADKPCPDYEVAPKLKKLVDAKIDQDRQAEKALIGQWPTPEARRYFELKERLKIEKERTQRFKDRGLAYSSHQKRRIIALEKALAALNYTPPPTDPLDQAITPKDKTSGTSLSFKKALLSFTSN